MFHSVLLIPAFGIAIVKDIWQNIKSYEGHYAHKCERKFGAGLKMNCIHQHFQILKTERSHRNLDLSTKSTVSLKMTQKCQIFRKIYCRI